MKNKKSLLGLGLFALILVLGVGYAVVSSVNLTFGGSATAKVAELSVDIASVVDTKTGSATVEHSLGSTHAVSDTFTIKDMVLDEEVTMVYTIDNHETDVDATLTAVGSIENDNEEYFLATATVDKASLPHGGTTTVTITVKLIKTPVAEGKDVANITYKVLASPAA